MSESWSVFNPKEYNWDGFMQWLPVGSYWKTKPGLKQYASVKIPHVIKISIDKTIEHFDRGEWKVWDDDLNRIQKNVYAYFDCEANTLTPKDVQFLENINSNGKKEIVVYGTNVMAVFLVPSNYDFESDKFQGDVSRKEAMKQLLDGADEWFWSGGNQRWVWDWNEWENPELWERFEFIAYCRKPYDLAPVKYSEDSDPNVNVLVNVTDSE